ncbi:MAG: putative membrane protein [Cenarchaeum symbiont of Oopsacas minuta]|nr:putative membrane protein [Cenarchaeum symbiont of Oopsacas minuta]
MTNGDCTTVLIVFASFSIRSKTFEIMVDFTTTKLHTVFTSLGISSYGILVALYWTTKAITFLLHDPDFGGSFSALQVRLHLVHTHMLISCLISSTTVGYNVICFYMQIFHGVATTVFGFLWYGLQY